MPKHPGGDGDGVGERESDQAQNLRARQDRLRSGMRTLEQKRFERMVLSWPAVINLDADVTGTAPARSWIPVARTGSFSNSRYGPFEITREHLATMVRNFKVRVLPTPDLPIDYEHLGSNPAHPGDSKAAGWIRDVALRDSGDSLYALVEWTTEGAQHIRERHYKYTSPSFVRDYTTQQGQKVGATLLAAALTNSPFLSMPAITLCDRSVTALLALAASPEEKEKSAMPFAHYESFEDCVAQNQDKDDAAAFCQYVKTRTGDKPAAVDMQALVAEWVSLPRDGAGQLLTSLSAVGQRVMIQPGSAHSQDQVTATFEIVEVVGEGDDAFVVLQDANGVRHSWFRATELVPASSTPAAPVPPNLVTPVQKEPQPGDVAAPAGLDIAQIAKTRKASVQHASLAASELIALSSVYKAEHGGSFTDAVLAVTRERRDLAEQHRESIGEPVLSALPSDVPSPATGELLQLSTDYAEKHHVDARTALHAVSVKRPDLATSHREQILSEDDAAPAMTELVKLTQAHRIVHGGSTRDALLTLSRDNAALQTAYRDQTALPTVAERNPWGSRVPEPVTPKSQFETLVARLAKEHKLSARDAVAEATRLHPDWAEAYRLTYQGV